MNINRRFFFTFTFTSVLFTLIKYKETNKKNELYTSSNQNSKYIWVLSKDDKKY